MKQIYAALILAQAEFPGVDKDGKNPHFKSKYVTFDNVVDTIRPILAKHKLGFIQPTNYVDDVVVVETILIHESGETIKCLYPIKPVSQKPQDYGSALTYAKRYSLMSLLGIAADEDDDGNKASQGVPKEIGNNSPFTPPPAKHNAVITKGGVVTTIERPALDHGKIKEIPESENGKYVITFGKHSGKTIQSLGRDFVKQYVEWIYRSSNESGKDITGKVLEFVTVAEKYLAEGDLK